MFATPSEAVTDRTISLWDDTTVRHVPVWVTGHYDREPAHKHTPAGHLPDIVIPIVATYADGRRVPEPHLLTAARVLAQRFYAATRDGIDQRQINARIVPMSVMLGSCYIVRCARTGIPVVVKVPSRDLEDAQAHVEALYHPDSPGADFLGIRTSRDVKPLDVKIF